MRVQAILGEPLTKADRAIIFRHGLGAAKRLERDVELIAHKLYMERITMRHEKDRKQKNLQPHLEPRPERKLPRRKGNDGVEPN